MQWRFSFIPFRLILEKIEWKQQNHKVICVFLQGFRLLLLLKFLNRGMNECKISLLSQHPPATPMHFAHCTVRNQRVTLGMFQRFALILITFTIFYLSSIIKIYLDIFYVAWLYEYLGQLWFWWGSYKCTNRAIHSLASAKILCNSSIHVQHISHLP